MRRVARMHKHPLKSAGFKVLKAPDVPSVLIELGYVSSKVGLEAAHLRRLAGADRRRDGAGDRYVLQHPAGRRGSRGRVEGRPMSEKPQFEHKNPRIVAVSDAPRLGSGSVRGVVGRLRRRQTGSHNFAVVFQGMAQSATT